MSLLDHGSSEGLKGSVHLAIGLLSAACAVYNLLAYVKRGEPHSAVNVLIYGALTDWERRMVDRHRGPL